MKAWFLSRLQKLHDRFVLRRREDILAKQIERLIPEGVTNVLDVGCGDGVIAALVAASRPSLAIEGAEVLDRPSCAIPYRIFDGRTLPYKDDTFDLVTLIDVLHHTRDAASLLAEAKRVSRKHVLIKDHIWSNRLDYSILTLMDWVGNRSHGVNLTYAYLKPGQWKNIFQKCELSVADTKDSLGLYPPPLSLLFENGKHFLALLAKREASPILDEVRAPSLTT